MKTRHKNVQLFDICFRQVTQGGRESGGGRGREGERRRKRERGGVKVEEREREREKEREREREREFTRKRLKKKLTHLLRFRGLHMMESEIRTLARVRVYVCVCVRLRVRLCVIKRANVEAVSTILVPLPQKSTPGHFLHKQQSCDTRKLQHFIQSTNLRSRSKKQNSL